MNYLKSILRAKSSTTDCYIYGEVGVYPFYVQRRLSVVKYWLKVLDAKANGGNLVSQIYDELYILSIINPTKIIWATLVRDILFKVGFGYIWTEQKVANGKQFLAIFKQRIEMLKTK